MQHSKPEKKKYIDYNHSQNIHSITGAQSGFNAIFPDIIAMPKSIIDIGCGEGFWLLAAAKSGVREIYGIDGIKTDRLVIDDKNISISDLSEDFSHLSAEKYDVALCLEVAEHLGEKYATNFIKNLVELSDTILFSAAIPGQPGQHHVNCQWPDYWQAKFNEHGFYCDDSIRWEIWTKFDIEPWYKQNIFIAQRDSNRAGNEPRILPVIHPEMLRYISPGVYWESVSEGNISKKSVLKSFFTSFLG